MSVLRMLPGWRDEGDDCPLWLHLMHPLAWAVPISADEAIFWSNCWPYCERAWPGTDLFLFRRAA